MIDIIELKHNIDLLALVEQSGVQLRKKANSGGGEWSGPCLFCGGNDRFNVQPNHPNGGIWLCRNCTEGKWKDVIDFVRRRDTCDFKTALKTLQKFTGTVLPVSSRASAKHTQRSDFSPKHSEPPPQEWQLKALEVIHQCVHSLWSADGAESRVWLNRRGIQDDTLKKWEIGYCPGAPNEWRTIAGLSVPSGIVIPCVIDTVVQYVKVRRQSGTPKYMQIKGGHPALFGADTLCGHDRAVICEGEFDTLLLHQEVHNLAGVITLGSASDPLDIMAWAGYLLPIADLLIAYDVDRAGNAGAQKLHQMTKRARRLSVPIINTGDKDITDYWISGGKLREWLVNAISGDDDALESAILAWGEGKGYTPTYGPDGHIVMNRDTHRIKR